MDGAHFVVTEKWVCDEDRCTNTFYYKSEQAARERFLTIKLDNLTNESHLEDRTGITVEELAELEAADRSFIEHAGKLYVADEGYVVESTDDTYTFFEDGCYCENHVEISIKEIVTED